MPKTIRQFSIDFEGELLCCVSSWRENAGSLSNIPIEVYADYDIDPTRYTQFNVNFHIEPSSDLFAEDQYNYSIVHKAGLYFQKIFPDDILIHIDADMYLRYPFPGKLLFFKDTLIGLYSDAKVMKYECPERYRYFKKFKLTRMVNTDLIITKPNSTFYSEYKKHFEILKNQIGTGFWGFEEFVADYITELNNYDTIDYYEDSIDIYASDLEP